MKKKELTLKTGENFTVRIPKLTTRIKFALQLIFKGQFTTNFYNLCNNKNEK